MRVVEILANVKAGLEQLRLTHDEVWGPIHADIDKLQRFRLTGLLRVTSLTRSKPDYWLLTFSLHGHRYASLLISAEGWMLDLLGWADSPAPEMPTAAQTDDVLRRAHLMGAARTWSYVFAPSNVSRGAFFPLAMQNVDGRRYFVNERGEIYEETLEGDNTDKVMWAEGSLRRLRRVRD